MQQGISATDIFPTFLSSHVLFLTFQNYKTDRNGNYYQRSFHSLSLDLFYNSQWFRAVRLLYYISQKSKE